METGSSIKETRATEMEALFYFESKNFTSAEKLLLHNLKCNTKSLFTYDLLIRIYHEKKDTTSLIWLLGEGIKNTEKKDYFRKFRKNVIVSKLATDFLNI